MALGNICASIKSDSLAEEYYRQALSYVTPSDEGYYSICLNRYIIDSHSPERRKEAIDSLIHLIPIFETKRDTGLLSVVRLNLGTCYQANYEPDKSFQCYNEMLQFIQFVDNDKLKFSLYQNLGNYYSAINEWKNALTYYDLAKAIAEDDKNQVQLSYVLFHLSSLYASMGRNDSAYHYLNEYSKLNSLLINNAKTIEAYQAYVSVFLESSENKLKIAEQEILLKNRRLLVAVISVIGAVILIILLLIINRQKRSQHLLLQENLASKVREVTSYSLLLSNKNNILQQISDSIKQLPENSQEIEKVNRIIKNNLNTEQDWDSFMLHFEEVHPNFFDKLKTHCSNLTKSNLRLCAYFRIGISTKEIAQILNVSPDTIKVNRHRLKKKLGLKEEENLDDFIRNM
jgi:tetratricopeptide (TPR) repeat protein